MNEKKRIVKRRSEKICWAYKLNPSEWHLRSHFLLQFYFIGPGGNPKRNFTPDMHK